MKTWPKPLSIGDIARRTGGKLRSLRLWADAGAIRPIPGTAHAGRGVHREFPESEIDVAAVLVALAPFGLPIGTMVTVGHAVRRLAAGCRRRLYVAAIGEEIVVIPATAAPWAGEAGAWITINVDAILRKPEAQ